MKYILVTGGVISGIGKGVVASSTGVILKHCGLDVTREGREKANQRGIGELHPVLNNDWDRELISYWIALFEHDVKQFDRMMLCNELNIGNF